MAYIPGFGHLSNPYIVFNDANGKPLSNGTVETYIAGTTTAYNTLKDWNGTYNGAIITLDIYGGCTIIAPETQGLKLIVKTSTGAAYKTFDNVFIGDSNQVYLPGTTTIRVDGTDGEIISVGTPDPDDPDKLIFTISLDPAITEAIATNASDIGGIQTHINNIDNSIIMINDTLDTLQTDVDIIESDVDTLQTDVDTLQSDVGIVESAIAENTSDITTMSVKVENSLRTIINFSDTIHVASAFPEANQNKYYLLASFPNLGTSRYTFKFDIYSFFNDLTGRLTMTLNNTIAPKFFYEQIGTSDSESVTSFFPSNFILGYDSALKTFHLFYFCGSASNASVFAVLTASLILNNDASFIPTLFNSSLVGSTLPAYTLYTPTVSNFYHVSSGAQLKQALKSKSTNNIWVDVNVTYTVGADDIWDCIDKKIIDGPGIITLVGSTTYSTFSANTYVEAKINGASNAGGLYTFKCPVIITGWIAIHFGYIWFDGGIDASIKTSSVLYGIKADSSARIYVTFSDSGYANIWPDHASTEKVYYNGQKGFERYDSTWMGENISSSVSTNPYPNCRRIVVVGSATITITLVWDPVNVDTMASMRGKVFFIELNGIPCGAQVSFVYPDMEGISRTVKIDVTAASVFGSFKVEQKSAGYLLGTISNKY